MCNAPADAHAVPLLDTLNLQSLQTRRESHYRKIIESIIYGKCHPGLHSLFEVKPDGSIIVPSSRTVIGRRRFSVVGAGLVNNHGFSPVEQASPIASGEACSRTSGGRRAGLVQLQPKVNPTPPLGIISDNVQYSQPSHHSSSAIIVVKED